MASCRDIVNGSLRKLGKLAGGREPRTQDSSDVLDSLKGLYAFLIGSGAFGRLTDVVPTGATYTAGENQRIFRNSDVTVTIDLPELVPYCSDGPRAFDEEVADYPTSTINYGARPPRDGSVIVISDAFTGETFHYIYDGQQKLWQGLYDLTLDSEAPLSKRDPDGLKSLLATRIADDFAAEIGATTAQMAGIYQTNLITRFSSGATAGAGVYF